MTHLYYGDPSAEFSLKLATTLLESGADMLEVGIPYTDPVCDGEVFQRACRRALDAGVTPFKVLEGIRRIRGNRRNRDRQKIYLTSYFAPIFKIGVRRFVGLAKEAGVAGLIVPDLLLEERGELRNECEKARLSLIQFATVYSDRARLKQIIEASSDFIYCVSLSGVTGENKLALSKVEGLLKLLRSMTEKSIFVGFGIKSKKGVNKILEMGADGVIMGSAIARMYERNIDHPEAVLSEIAAFIKELKESTI